MTSRKESSSLFQLELEEKLVRRLEEELKKTNLCNDKNIPILHVPGAVVCPDLYSEKHAILGEVHVHAGPLRAAQHHKIATDILKMILFEKDRSIVYEKYYIVCSEQEKKYLEGKSYVAAAVKLNNIKVKYYPLSDEDEKKLLAVMRLQDLREIE